MERSIDLFALLAIALFSLSPNQANAAHSAIALGCCSHHTAKGDFNEFNPGLGIEYGRLGQFLTAGVMEDSDKNLSWYTGGGLRGSLNRYTHVGLFLGIVNRKDRGTIPAILPSLTLGTDKMGINLVYVPPIQISEQDKRKTQVLWLQFRFGFNTGF